jgi:hypothetical protein
MYYFSDSWNDFSRISIIIIIITSLCTVTNQPYYLSIYKNYKGCFSLGFRPTELDRVTKYRLKFEILLYALKKIFKKI